MPPGFPSPRQSTGAAFAAAMMPASDRLFSGDWWKEKKEGIARQRAQQQSMADYYARTTKEQEERENAEARERSPRKAFESVRRHLRSVELHARGLDGFSVNTPSLLTSVCLYDWDTGRQIFGQRVTQNFQRVIFR
jgi:hypothetical protein